MRASGVHFRHHVLAYLLALSALTVAQQQPRGNTKVLIVGDSITHCNEGDYTWRYRIWSWFQSSNLVVDFVGPYIGTAEPDTPEPPKRPRLYGEPEETPPLRVSGKYAAEFDSNHFAISGRAAAQVKDTIHDVVAEFTPDLILVLLGYNDLAFGFGNATGTLINMQTLIQNARAAKSETAFVIGTVPQRTWTGAAEQVRMTDEYNRRLRREGVGWSLDGSPVVIAPVREEYDCGPQYSNDECPAAHDGLHPNELGEYQIARAFSRALVSGLKMGESPLEVPSSIPPRPLPVPGDLEMDSSGLGVTATWDKVFGAYTYDTEYRLNGVATPAFKFSPTNVRANRWDTRWDEDGEIYDLRIRPIAGNRKGTWTDWQSATATPRLPQAPENVTASSTATGIDLSWALSQGNYSANLFNIYYWDINVTCTNMILSPTAAFEGTSGHIDGLVAGHRYNLAIEAWNDDGPGIPRGVGSVVVGGSEEMSGNMPESACPEKVLGTPPETEPIDTSDPKAPPS
ncbi:Putative fibronectin type III, immunoglobulin-like, SGNH hydrolase-type esterase [Septoria linicola]|uniref:Fibronectin type III, immunoglobulin-like, SGNH hydrolase-type esterase n=1 Tax=Septoria linicola TaxID=215465 RepID=A0A9Q9EJ42_9PEZI|nr:putative fibronectin type III, immunoglobulin-like, SGNH hydrolase-type esterase [Septoria linicola]USW50973.1 Putative fibronectin type III, immunoglobulin-like, SGNH hydrolase-type esterase [Septoria linicola]